MVTKTSPSSRRSRAGTDPTVDSLLVEGRRAKFYATAPFNYER